MGRYYSTVYCDCQPKIFNKLWQISQFIRKTFLLIKKLYSLKKVLTKIVPFHTINTECNYL